MDDDALPPPPAADEPLRRCAVCGTEAEEGALDDAGWCAACRETLVRRSGRWALLPAAVVALLYAWLVVWVKLMQSPLMIFWVALGLVLAFVAYKVGRRVAFDVLRDRATDAEG